MGRRQQGRGGLQLSSPDPRRSAQTLAGHAPARHWAEELAERALLAKGYQLLARNYRLRGGEIDLVLRAPDATVVFVEVRQRLSSAFGGAGASISLAKQRRLRSTATHYLATVAREPDATARFDAVLVTGEGPRARLSHVEDAF